MQAVSGYVLLLLTLLIGPAGPATAAAGEEPEERVRLIVPGGTGGGSDLVARRLAVLSEPLGMPVDVISRPGSDGLRALAGATPDGRTLALLASEMLIDPALGDMPRLTPIMLFNHDLAALHVRADASGENVLAGVLAGERTASGGPAGSLWHLALAHVAASRGQVLPRAAWRSAADEAVAVDLLSDGEVALVTAPASQADALRRAGRVTSIGEPALADGLPQALAGWRGIVGPPGMSSRDVVRLRDAVRAATASEPFARFMTIRGYRVIDLEPEAFARLLARFEQELRVARAAIE